MIVLAADAVGYRLFELSLLVLAVLAVISVLRLAVLGPKLFNFFDPSSLRTPLARRFQRALRRGLDTLDSAGRGKPGRSAQRRRGRLQLYRMIARMPVDRPVGDAAARANIALQLRGIAAECATRKTAIPSAGLRWNRVPSHPNWLTLDHTRLGVALPRPTLLSCGWTGTHPCLERVCGHQSAAHTGQGPRRIRCVPDSAIP